MIIDAEHIKLFVLLDFLTGTSLPDLAAMRGMSIADIEDLIRSAMLTHGYGAGTRDLVQLAGSVSPSRDSSKPLALHRRASFGDNELDAPPALPELRRLHAFLVLAHESHFHNAAARLRVSQSPLSRTIKNLERDLELQLFNRNTRTVRLTQAGEVLREEAHHLLARSTDAVFRARAVTGSENSVDEAAR